MYSFTWISNSKIKELLTLNTAPYPSLLLDDISLNLIALLEEICPSLPSWRDDILVFGYKDFLTIELQLNNGKPNAAIVYLKIKYLLHKNSVNFHNTIKKLLKLMEDNCILILIEDYKIIFPNYDSFLKEIYDNHMIENNISLNWKNPSGLFFSDSFPPIDLSDIRLLEKKKKCNFPLSYQGFLLKINGGEPYPQYFNTPQKEIGYIEYFFGLNSNRERKKINLVENSFFYKKIILGNEYICIAKAYINNKETMICLCIKGEHHGKIQYYCIDEEKEDILNWKDLDHENLKLLANNFLSFIKMLKLDKHASYFERVFLKGNASSIIQFLEDSHKNMLTHKKNDNCQLFDIFIKKFTNKISFKNQKIIFRYFINKGCKSCQVDLFNVSNPQLLPLLLEYGFPLNDGLWHYTIQDPNFKLVQFLLKKGAKFDYIINKNENIIDIIENRLIELKKESEFNQIKIINLNLIKELVLSPEYTLYPISPSNRNTLSE